MLAAFGPSSLAFAPPQFPAVTSGAALTRGALLALAPPRHHAGHCNCAACRRGRVQMLLGDQRPTDPRSMARRASTQYLMRLKTERLGADVGERERQPTSSGYTAEHVSEAGWENIEIFADNRVRAGRAVFVAEPRAGVHDDATVQLQRRMRLRVGELKNIDVHAEERGRGAGTVLLEEMVSVLRARGCRYCILRHLDASRPAAGFKKGGLIRWYEKHGFRLARDVLPKSLEFIDTDHMVAEVNDIYLRTPSAVAL